MYFFVLLKEQFESNNILKHLPPLYVRLVNVYSPSTWWTQFSSVADPQVWAWGAPYNKDNTQNKQQLFQVKSVEMCRINHRAK